MLLKLRKPVLKYTIIKNHVHLKHLNLPIGINKIPATMAKIRLYLHDS